MTEESMAKSMARAARVRRSTLKPFVYALAIEQGIIHPLSVLADAPRPFWRIQSGKFDRDFSWSASRQHALARSRTSRPSTRRATFASESLRISATRDVPLPEPELSLWTRAADWAAPEVTMQDLGAALRPLSRQRRLRPLRRTAHDPASTRGLRSFAEASFLTLQMLGKSRGRNELCDAASAAPVFLENGNGRTGFAMPGRSGFSIINCLRFGLQISTARMAPLLDALAAAPFFFQIIGQLGARTGQSRRTLSLRKFERVKICSVSR